MTGLGKSRSLAFDDAQKGLSGDGGDAAADERGERAVPVVGWERERLARRTGRRVGLASGGTPDVPVDDRDGSFSVPWLEMTGLGKSRSLAFDDVRLYVVRP